MRSKEYVKRALTIISCVLSYLAAAFFAFYEVFWIYVWIDRTLYVVKWGAENAPREAEYADGAVFLAMMTAIPLVLLLMLAIYLTIKLRKRGKENGHAVPDK